MRTGQRDVHNIPLKRRLSISYEELETLKKTIKVTVLNELRADIENISDQEAIKDLVLSEIREELTAIPSAAQLKASILNELKIELNAPKVQAEDIDRRVKELAGIQDGLVRELLDQKVLIKRLQTQIENQNKRLEDTKRTAITTPPSITFSLPEEDPLDLPPLVGKTRQKTEVRNETPARYTATEFRKSPLPDSSTKNQLKLEPVKPKELDAAEIETKCEYIIAESGDKRRFKANTRQQPQQKVESIRQQRNPFSAGKPSPVQMNSASSPLPEDDYKCEYIIAEKTSKKYFVEESVDTREKEDAELIICSRKSPRAR